LIIYNQLLCNLKECQWARYDVYAYNLTAVCCDIRSEPVLSQHYMSHQLMQH